MRAAAHVGRGIADRRLACSIRMKPLRYLPQSAIFVGKVDPLLYHSSDLSILDRGRRFAGQANSFLKQAEHSVKAVILAGGLGTRISEETTVKPKPMVEIGGRPILWHIMKLYSAHGVNDFVICCGYKGYVIKEYFANYFLHMSDVTFDMTHNHMEVHQRKAEPWRVTLVDTGEDTMTGGRLKRVAGFVRDEKAFCFTYGDGLSNIDIKASIEFHHSHGKLATIAAVTPPGRYGALERSGEKVTAFAEKPRGDGAVINGGFFVLSPACIDLIAGDHVAWESTPLTELAARGELMAYPHPGFWQPMDTLREKMLLEELWAGGNAPWKIW
jgi:glucose-1-phosphate cytidylyltransferase